MFRKAVTVVVAASIATFALAGPAAADTTAAVDKAEYDLIKIGSTLGYVNSVFDSLGTQTSSYTGTSIKTQTREWDTVYGDYGWVDLGFKAQNGKWVVTSKHVYWDRDVARTSDKAVKSEYDAVKLGMSITDVRKKFGTSGTVTAQYQSTSAMYANLSWPTESEYGSVDVNFKWSNGTYRVISKNSYWGIDAVETTDKAVKSEYDAVKLGMTITDVRKKFGTSGTVISQYHSSGNLAANLSWPTESPYGYVDVDFKWKDGTYRVVTKSAYWAIDAVRTADKATTTEYSKVTTGMTLADVRKTFGTSGTVITHLQTSGKMTVGLSWPTEYLYGWVDVDFEWKDGTYRVVRKSAYWG